MPTDTRDYRGGAGPGPGPGTSQSVHRDDPSTLGAAVTVRMASSSVNQFSQTVRERGGQIVSVVGVGNGNSDVTYRMASNSRLYNENRRDHRTGSAANPNGTGTGSPVERPSARNDGKVPDDPYKPQWQALIDQLMRTASGQGESLAEMRYRDAAGDAVAQQRAMAAGGRSAQAARQAQTNVARIGQGMAGGVAQARLGEQQAAQQSLMSALTGGGTASFQRDKANQDAFLAWLAQNTNMSIAQLQAAMQKYGIDASQPGWLDQLLSVIQVGATIAAIPSKPNTPQG